MPTDDFTTEPKRHAEQLAEPKEIDAVPEMVERLSATIIDAAYCRVLKP